MFAVIISWELWSRFTETVRFCLASNTQVQDAPMWDETKPLPLWAFQKAQMQEDLPSFPKMTMWARRKPYVSVGDASCVTISIAGSIMLPSSSSSCSWASK